MVTTFLIWQARTVVLAIVHRSRATTRDAWRVFVPDGAATRDGTAQAPPLISLARCHLPHKATTFLIWQATLSRADFRGVVEVLTGGLNLAPHEAQQQQGHNNRPQQQQRHRERQHCHGIGIVRVAEVTQTTDSYVGRRDI